MRTKSVNRDLFHSKSGLRSTNPHFYLRDLHSETADIRDPIGHQRRLLSKITKDNIRFPARLKNTIKKDYFYRLPDVNIEDSPVKNNPRVVGLLVNDAIEQTGFVNPLIVKRDQKEWKCSHYLPFRAGHIQDALFRLLEKSGHSLEEWTPELVLFSIEEELNHRSGGSSMTLAALLAIVDAFNDKDSSLFRCACCLVEPVGDEITSVGSIEEKLNGFIREYGRGSLLVRRSDAEDAEHFDEYFDDRWLVDSFQDLADKLVEHNLIDALFEEFPLTMTEVNSATTRIEWLAEETTQLDALQFAKRVKRVSTRSKEAPLRVSLAIDQQLEDLNRDLGQFKQAVQHSSNVLATLEELGNLASHEELIDVRVRRAAAKFDAHEFQFVYDELLPLTNTIETDPYRVKFESQYMLYNTLARGMVVLEKEGWQEWFDKSLEIQNKVDRGNIHRTKAYLIHGLLRHGLLDEAKQELDALESKKSTIHPYTWQFLTGYRACYARQCGETWEDSEYEKEGKRKAFAFYLQATARQEARTVEDRSDRFLRAARAFHDESKPTPAPNETNSEPNIQALLAGFMRLSAAILSSHQPGFESAMTEIRTFLKQEGTEAIKRWYERFVPEDLKSAKEKLPDLLNAVPYF